mgnify:CR=1 FL=1
MSLEYLEWEDMAFAFDRKDRRLFLMDGDKMRELDPRTSGIFTDVTSRGTPISKEEAMEWAEEFAENRVVR